MSIKQYESELKRLKKLQKNKIINRAIFRASKQALEDELFYSMNNIDKLAFTKNSAIKYNKHDGEINTRIVQSKYKQVKLWS